MKRYIAFFMLSLPIGASVEVSAAVVCPSPATDSLGRSAVYAASPSLSLSGDRNYVLQKSYTAKQAGNPINTISYYDAFGRLSQTIEMEFTPEGRDAVCFNEYLRTQSLAKDTQWLPWIMQGNGAFNTLTSPLKESICDYHGDSAPFATTYYEASPGNNPVAQYKPGYDTFTDEEHMTPQPGELSVWQPIGGNTEADILRIQSAENGYYAYFEDCFSPGELTVSKLEGENRKEIFVYKDLSSKIVMSRVFGENGESLDTYYVYNESGPSLVITPELIPLLKEYTYMDPSDMERASSGYAYVYDRYNRITEKKVPGTNVWTVIIYNKAGQIVLYSADGCPSDGNLIYFTYDSSGKVSGKSEVSTSLNMMYEIRDRFYASTASEKPDLWNLFTKNEFSYVGPYDGDVAINTGYEHPDPEDLSGIPSEKLPAHPGHSAEFSEGLNDGGWNCVKLALNEAADGVRIDGYYGSGELVASRSADEDGRKSFLFRDQLGRDVLSRRVGDGGAYFDTYYVYDELGNLAMVFPPALDSLLRSRIDMSIDDPKFAQYGYAYRYDPYNRVVERKLPGAGWIYQVYDNADRLVLTQDGEQRLRNEWTYCVYDKLGRVVSRSLVRNGGSLSRAVLQARYDAADFDNSYPVLGGSDNPYKPFPTNEFVLVDILSDDRYGGYEYLPVWSGASVRPSQSGLSAFEIPSYLAFSPVDDVVIDSDVDNRTTGLKVYDRQLMLNPANDGISQAYVERAYYYDSKGRVVQTVERNHLGGISWTSVKYDFVGNILAQCESHQTEAGDTPPDTKTTRFGYDLRGRLLSEVSILDGSAPAVVRYGYDDQGRLVTKTCGETSVSAKVRVDSTRWLKVDTSKPLKTNWSVSDIMVYGSSSHFSDYDIYDFVIEDDSDVINPEYFICTDASNSRIEYYYLPQMEKLNSEIVSWAIAMYCDFTWDKSPRLEVVTIPFPGAGVGLSEVDVYRESTGAGLTEEFGYTLQGWLSEQRGDRFGMRLRYYDPQHSDTKPSYTGNITEWDWQHRGPDIADSQPNTYCFAYDALSRLTDTRQYIAGVPDDRFVEKGLSYDRNGNILTLKRTSGGVIADSLVYSYSGNQLTALSGTISPFDYTYDANGNMTYDGANNLDLTYNLLNLTEKVSGSDGIEANYSYLSDGTKLSATDASGNGLFYLGSLVYRKQGGKLSLESGSFGGGRFVATASGLSPVYHLTDHLGSVRVVFDADGEILERNDYYAFGLRWDNSASPISDNRYRYNGKEEQAFVNVPYTDYGARMYDPKYRLGWGSVDPLAEKYYPVGPYVFCLNNSIRLIDPDGRKVYFADGVSQEFKDKFTATIRYMNSKGTSGNMAKLEASENVYYINEAKSVYKTNFNAKTKTINWDPNHLVLTDEGILMSPATALAHEADHAQRYDKVVRENDDSAKKEYNDSIKPNSDNQYSTKEERRVIQGAEQSAARKHGDINAKQTTRKNHKGTQANLNVSNMKPGEISKKIYESNNQYIIN